MVAVMQAASAVKEDKESHGLHAALKAYCDEMDPQPPVLNTDLAARYNRFYQQIN